MSEIGYATEKSDVGNDDNEAEDGEIGEMYLCMDGV